MINIQSSPRRIRTVTEQVLNLLPLPIGLQDRGGIISPNIRSTTLTLTGQAVYQISSDAILANVLPQGLEPRTLSLRGISSNQLSYKSMVIFINFHDFITPSGTRTHAPRLHVESSAYCAYRRSITSGGISTSGH